MLNPRHFTAVNQVDSALSSNPGGDSSEDDALFGPETLEEDSSSTARRLGPESSRLADLRQPVLHANRPVEEHGVPSNQNDETGLDLQVPHTPTKEVLHSVTSSATPNRTATIDPAVLFTPPHRIIPSTPASSISPCVNASLRLSSMTRLSARQRSSTPNSPPRRTSIWRAQRNRVRASY